MNTLSYTYRPSSSPAHTCGGSGPVCIKT